MSRTLALAVFGRPALPGGTLTDQAARWADHVFATSNLPPEYVTRKALDAVAFSIRHGLRDLSVPSKLVGVAGHQLAVEALALYDELPAPDRPRLIVSHTLDVHAVRSDRSLRPVGRVQPKHAAWLAPLLGRGAAVHLHRVTGFERRAQNLPVTLGVNVRIAGIVHALDVYAASRERAEPSTPLTLVADPSAPYQGVGEGGRPRWQSACGATPTAPLA